MSPDRTCLSDGDCVWWVPIDPVQEVIRVKRMLEYLQSGGRDEVRDCVAGTVPEV